MSVKEKNEKFVAIIDNGGANFASISAALNRLNVKSEVTCEPKKINEAAHIILPGVGSAGYAMKHLIKKDMIALITSLRQPVLGICLGQQLLCTASEEEDTDCLDIIPMRVIKIRQSRIIPHMGWNNLTEIRANEPLLEGITVKDNFYFVHSFSAEINKNYTLGVCHYGIDFSAVIKKNNFYGVQFHPEKSGEAGLKILRNFLNIENQ